MLRSFEIEGFRAFRHLTVPKLARVNLIVGRNNVGKTMFLEALRLYFSEGDGKMIRSLLSSRDEITADHSPGNGAFSKPRPRIDTLFHRNGKATNGAGPKIVLKEPGDEANQIDISPILVKLANDGAARDVLSQAYGEQVSHAELEARLFPALEVSLRGGKVLSLFNRLEESDTDSFKPRRQEPAFIPSSGLSNRELAEWWDEAVLRGGEDRVIDCLKTLEENAQRISFVENPLAGGGRYPIIRLKNETLPVPLKSLGDGMNRVFQLALAIEKAISSRLAPLDGEQSLFPPAETRPTRTPLLLIDEIDNGLHYSAHAGVWELILRAAVEHDIQVVSTTHSWDCIRGLRDAVEKHPDSDALLIRLERNALRDKAVSFEQHELDVVVREEIEVR